MDDQKLPAKEQPQGQKIKKTILVVEDDVFYSNIYKLKLTKEGYDVIIAEDGQEALKFARVKKPNIILLDLIMPTKDGFQTLRELKADTNLKDIKVVILSNLGQEEDIKEAKTLGAIDYLIKTNYSIQQILEKIGQYLR